ncbi:4-(cytidine 5'-diphospho)-2-C-methyl-D-erythritol kinase [Virgibacillus indicus]|uniref:4-diphosphocytidyl-2-C-methyl-D-erythritol kinase n=1 Tax=Virgibacillus indicus TaxID=2024554 RepID=A0A265NCH3_9BACI|nr:4-(cytidine 5'-diphospho)-2-C-methyl-D-erythritol kinase [Virgibacillus indicus]OZU89521.1 4-(cytidine 5'-diphospho)-2-C-methyl-D-erythritol kinase [Virgibacillus indicus]
MALFEKAPAKINLALDVLSKRDDGFHNVEMLMTTIDLADRIKLTSLEEDRIEISLESRFVPSDERNLAYKAAFAFKKKYGIEKGVQIHIEKSIPVSAGLGGGSSDAAAVLRGLNRLWSLDRPMGELAELGADIGSDVPFCVYGNTGIAKGRGEIVEKLAPPPPCWVVLAKPDIGVSTRTIFQRIILDDLTHPNTDQIISALENKDFDQMCCNIGNVLENITLKVYPEVRRIKNAMIQAGAAGTLMSGSGPTVYGLVEHYTTAKRIYNGMRGFCHEVYLVRLLG